MVDLMPMVIAPALVAAGVSGGIAIGGTIVSFASIAAYGVSLGATMGANLLLRSLEKRKATSNQQITVRQAITARVRGYGRAKMGGAMFYMGATRTLAQGFIFCEGPIDAYEEVWLADKKIIYTEGSNFCFAGWSWTNYVMVDLQIGAVGQSRNPAFDHIDHYWWDGTHQNQGLANAVMRCYLPNNAETNFTKTYQNGVPALRVVARLSLVYDPRSGATEWSDNPGLCIRDYLTSSRGFNIPASRINDASFMAFATMCDILVANTQETGGHEQRYRVWMTYTLDEQPSDVLRRLLASCDGEIYPLPDGTIGIRGGVWEDPTVTITDDMILGYEVQTGRDKLSAFNQLRIRYTAKNNDYQVQEGGAWNDTAAQTESGQIIPQDFDGTMCASYMQARRLAKIAMHKGNPQWLLTLTTSMAGLNALGERIIRCKLDDLGIDATFYVQKFEIAGDLKSCSMTLASLNSDAYEWTTSEEYWSPPPATDAEDGFTIPVPTGLALHIVQLQLGSNLIAFEIGASVTAPDDASFGALFQISLDGGVTWADMSPDGVWSANSGIIASETACQVQAAFKASASNIGTFCPPVSITTPGGSLGPVALALSEGANQDYGLASAAATISDDFGLASVASIASIDLGLAS
ncbi:hypothetical protein [Methylocella silvestris]|uniref:Tip attachment protein J domain-containing protein n=1 Tax=Methylocella silvestris TaxID=199596 RepID=A0A2J7TJQ0_METSI|nr:hypothetical protein [Methylocella silvestris]PNG26998.1 hypothetical protein CR492_04660 [Methylocella silvestris]